MSSKPSNSVGQHTDTNSSRRIPTKEGTLSFAEPGTDLNEADIVLDEVGTARSEWLPVLLRRSLPWLYEGAERVAAKYYPRGLAEYRDGPVANYLQEHGVTALHGTYALAAAQLATYTDRQTVETTTAVTVLPRERLYQIVGTLTELGYNKDPFNSGIDDIENGPASLVALSGTTPTLCIELDSADWSKKRRRLRIDALDTISRLKRGYDVRIVASARVKKRIRTQHPEWCDEHLTENGSSSDHQHPSPTGSGDTSTEIDSELWNTLTQIPAGGRFELLDTIPAKRKWRRTVESFKQDSSLDIAAGTIDRYYRELEAHGLVTVLEPDGSNELYLTSRGQAVQALLTDDFELQHPTQADLITDLPHPPQPHTSRVCGGDSREPKFVGQLFEEALQANETGLRNPKPRQLPFSDCRLDERAQFDRLAGYQIAEGVTLVDERIGEFEDGRRTYFGARGSESHVVVQWGGALPTLVRTAVTLLSDLAFNQVLNSENLGPVLTETNALDELRRRMQIGWASTPNHGDLRANLQQRARGLLGQIGAAKSDPDLWARVAREAHGLITSATALFDAAEYDVTIHVRVPDTEQLSREDSRYGNFLQFVKATVPKSYQYKGHSASRLLLETDGDKLKYRFSDVVDPDDLVAQPTSNWVVVGPQTTDFRGDVVEALQRTPIRDQVADGTELGIRIPVEVATTDSVSAVREVVQSTVNRLVHDFDADVCIDRLSKLLMLAFHDPVRDRHPSPGDIVEVLTLAAEFTATGESVAIEQIARGLGYVDSDRLYPWLPPSARSTMSALYRSQGPLQRKEILDSASISKSSYSRHRSTLEAVGLLADVGGYRYEAVVPDVWASAKNNSELDVPRDIGSKRDTLLGIVKDAFSTTPPLSELIDRIVIG